MDLVSLFEYSAIKISVHIERLELIRAGGRVGVDNDCACTPIVVGDANNKDAVFRNESQSRVTKASVQEKVLLQFQFG